MFAGMKTPARILDPDIKRLLDESFDEELRASVQTYLRICSMSATRFGRLVVGDPGFVSNRLQPGRTVTLDTVDRVRRFIGVLEFRPLFCGELAAFMQVTKFKPWTLGWRSVGQTSFVARLRLGGSPHLATLDRCREWMREQVGTNDRWANRNAVAVKSANGAGAHAYPALLLETIPERTGGADPCGGAARAAAGLRHRPGTERHRTAAGGVAGGSVARAEAHGTGVAHGRRRNGRRLHARGFWGAARRRGLAVARQCRSGRRTARRACRGSQPGMERAMSAGDDRTRNIRRGQWLLFSAVASAVTLLLAIWIDVGGGSNARALLGIEAELAGAGEAEAGWVRQSETRPG